MRKLIIFLLLVIPVALTFQLIFLFFEPVLRPDYQILVDRIEGVNSSELLAGCRQLISQREKYAEHTARPPWAVRGEVVLDSTLDGFYNSMPMSLTKMGPVVIWIREDSVLIRFRIPRRRIALLAFKENAEEYGTRKISDGLWYWNLSHSSGPRKESVP